MDGGCWGAGEKESRGLSLKQDQVEAGGPPVSQATANTSTRGSSSRPLIPCLTHSRA